MAVPRPSRHDVQQTAAVRVRVHGAQQLAVEAEAVAATSEVLQGVRGLVGHQRGGVWRQNRGEDEGSLLPRVVSQSYREQFREGDEEADRENDGKTTSESGLALNGKSYCRENDGKTASENGLALNGLSYCGKLRTARSGGSWLENLQWCLNGQPDDGNR